MLIRSFAAQQAKMTAYDLAAHIGKTTKLIAELYNDKTVEGISRYENIQELLNSIKEFVEEDVVPEHDLLTEAGPGDQKTILLQDKSLGSFLQTVTLLTGDEKSAENADSVKLMTVH